ncbi:hypothetical protein Tco_0704172 [Tanacetum coccineum]|uniref:Uncharacterized protein n=1 Tax=Tanacetum coccineum TaxID=301880 RepID=A0ABQ4Y1W1_9ASTR
MCAGRIIARRRDGGSWDRRRSVDGGGVQEDLALKQQLELYFLELYVERVNRGCVPSKALLAVSGLIRELQDEHHMKTLGIQYIVLDQSRKVRVGMVANSMSFYSFRPERRRPDSKSIDWNSSRVERDRGEVNIQADQLTIGQLSFWSATVNWILVKPL